MPESTKTVLIIDDEPAVLRLLTSMLGSRGVKLISVTKPQEALHLCQQYKIDLLIADISMPEMNGVALTARVLEMQPDTSVLLISGDYDEMPESVESPRARFLSKPFFPSQLLARMRELLPDI